MPVYINGVLRSDTTLTGNGVVSELDKSDIVLNQVIDTVLLNGVADLNLEVKPQFLGHEKLVLEAEENILPFIKIELKGTTLEINLDGNFTTFQDIVVHLGTSQLSTLKSIGTGDTNGLYIGNSLNIKCSGTGDVTLKGQAQSLDVKSSGTGDINLKNLQTQNIKLVLSGTGDAKIWSEKTVSIESSGTGDIKVWGNPEQLKKNNSGLGKIKFKDDHLVLSEEVLSQLANTQTNSDNVKNQAQNSENTNIQDNFDESQSLKNKYKSFL